MTTATSANSTSSGESASARPNRAAGDGVPPGLSPVRLPKAVLVMLVLVWLGWVGFLASLAF